MDRKYKKDLVTRVAYVGGTALMAFGGVVFINGMPRDAIYLVAYGSIIDTLGFLHDQWRHKQYDNTENK